MLLLVGVLTSCYDDKSKEADREIIGVTITTATDVLDAVYGKTLVVAPEIKKGTASTEKLTYLWQINLRPNGSDLLDIGEGATLEYNVSNEPNTNPYLLVLTVTDPEEGLSYYKSWEVYVSSSMGEGLVVAHTADGGTTSDISFVKAPQLAYGYTGAVEYTHNLYSLANGEKINGKVNSLVANVASNGATYNLSRILVGTDNDLFTLSAITFARTMEKEDLFFSVPETCEVQTISNSYGSALVTVIGGKAYAFMCNGGYQFASPMNYNAAASQVFSGKMAVEKASGNTAPFTCYDEKNGYFLIATWMVFNNGASSILTQSLAEGQYQFDPGNLKNKKTLKAGVGNNSEHMHLLRDLSTQADTIYKISSVDYVVGGTGKIALDACTNIKNAVDYAFCENMNVMYYATENQVYPALLAGSSAATGTPWSLTTTGEKITAIQMYQQGWYGVGGNLPDSYTFTSAQHNKQLLVTTYNASTGEGKIYLLPITSLGSGDLGAEVQVLGGFGEITAIGTTLR